MSDDVALLRAEIADDRAVWRRLVEELRGVDPTSGDAGDVARVVLALHHGYSAVEAIVERVVRFVHGDIPFGPDWHRRLMEDARIEVRGVRPALISRSAMLDLAELRSFRHVVRHAYAAEYDPERLAHLRARALAVAPTLESDLDALDAWLAASDGAPE